MDATAETKSAMLFARASPTLMQRIDVAAAEDQRKTSEWVRLALEERLDLRDRGLEATIKALLRPQPTR